MTGVWSSLKSPVWMTVPTGVWIAKPHGVRDAVRDAERLDPEDADAAPTRRAGSCAARSSSSEVVLLELDADEAAGQRRAVDRRVDAAQDVGQAADVVLVAVGDEDGPQLVAVLLDVGDVRDDEVDAEHLLFGEHEAGVDDDHVVAVLEQHHVLADLAETAEGDDAELLIVCH